ncbi:hypothetical protein Pan258_51190 [Symmachiella dynata]|uniref:ArnT family glycosyltransferase n=1 Tax=Symmachiella dynata TaxID=2527995 RepID=UPI00118938FC|nr:glycosyltransferase family 39 protein [Symmachiella dynata]QDT51036.1 hypothetical protein Pan258_51190 [Symmachiella dynata]
MSVEFKKIDDDQLQRMAAEPIRPLFAVLDHARAMVPWVVLLACLPALIAVMHRPLTDTNAAWGLKALKLSSAPTVSAFVAPGSNDDSIPYRWQPPLISWLAAWATNLFGPWTPSALILAPFVANACFLGAVYALAFRIGDAKLGLLTVGLAAFHVNILTNTQTVSPIPVGLFFAVLTIWAFVGHLHKSKTTLSANLLIGGIALGFCLLSGGILAIVVVITLALHAIVIKRPLRRAADLPPVPRSQTVNRAPTLRSLSVMSLTAFAVGGWWELMMGYSQGQPFWRAWITGDAGYTTALKSVAKNSAFILPRDASELMLVLAGPILYGLWMAVREIQIGEKPKRCRDLQLLIVWTLVAAICWQLARTNQFTAASGEMMWQGFLLVPLLTLGAGGILRILDGRASTWSVALVGLITAANLVWHAPAHLAKTGLITMFIMIVLIGVLALIASFRTEIRSASPYERRESRLLISAFVVMLVIGHCLSGFTAVPRAGAADDELRRLSHALSKLEQPVTQFTIVSADPSDAAPIQLEYLARATWPTAQGNVFTNWNDVPNWTDVGVAKKDIPITKQTPAHVYFLWQTPLIPFAAAGAHSDIMRFQEYYQQRQISVLVRPATGN